MPSIQPLSDEAELDAAIEESRVRPVVLFKHSVSCGISCEALDALHAHIEGADTVAAYRLITVQRHRHVSDRVATRLGVRHETPQAIVIRDGRPVWTASHFRVTSAALDKALAD